MRRPTTCLVGILPWLLIAGLVAIQPLGVLGHVLYDHLNDHGHAAHEAVDHQGDAHPSDHDPDHGHLWTTPALVLVTPTFGYPQGLRAGIAIDDIPFASAALRPPFSPPRA